MTATLKLGCADAGALPADKSQCTVPYHDWTSSPQNFRGEANNSWFRLKSNAASKVITLQRNLRKLGFKPKGALDGIFGYRTQSSVRLFQEYVRSVEGQAGIGIADGLAGRKTLGHIERWINNGLKADWTPVDSKQSDIFAGLENIRRHFMNQPDEPAIRILNEHAGPSCSRKVADWRFDPADIHLVGIRRNDTNVVKVNGKYLRRNDDLFVLLVNGLRFVFRGSTDPSPSMAGRDDAAFLIRGQHEYRFGWHKIGSLGSDTVKVYRAYKPKAFPGPLVVRAIDGQLTPASYSHGASANYSINIHWSGSGTSNWSAGCQVIAGKKYRNFRNDIVDLSAIAAPGYSALGGMTRGAYDVLIDMTTVFADDCRCASSDIINYTLLYESDLANVPGAAGIDFQGLIAELA